MMKKIGLGLVALSLVFVQPVQSAQETPYFRYTKKIVRKLSSPKYWGRGYTKNGMKKAAHFIANELDQMGVESLDSKSYFQSYSHPVNTFPGKMRVKINGRVLEPGVDFILSPGSRGVVAEGTLSPNAESPTDRFQDQVTGVRVVLKEKLTFGVSKKVLDYTEISLDRKRFKSVPKRYEVEIENVFKPSFEALNVMGVVRGTREPNRYVVLSAHYDHLGGLGKKTFFPGANDNASGTAFLLSLARYYVKNPAEYSIAFLFFGSEEAGLVGSKYFVENSPIPLSQIRFVTNFDLVGTGSDGFTVVNATEFPKEFETLSTLNKSHGKFVDIGARGKAANSDHYWFSENGVPSFFIYTRGGTPAYHDVFDRARQLPLDHVDRLRRLVVRFQAELIRSGY